MISQHIYKNNLHVFCTCFLKNLGEMRLRLDFMGSGSSPSHLIRKAEGDTARARSLLLLVRQQHELRGLVGLEIALHVPHLDPIASVIRSSDAPKICSRKVSVCEGMMRRRYAVLAVVMRRRYAV